MAKRSNSSRRAAILKKILPFINSGDWAEMDDYFVFGVDAHDRARFGDHRDEIDDALDVLKKIVEDTQRASGQILARKKITLDKESFVEPDHQNLIDSLSPDVVATITRALERRANDVHGATDSEYQTLIAESDHLDLKFAEEVLGKLEKIVDRSIRLSEPDLRRIPNKSVQRTFLEAHRCYLYGFDQSCAIWCRAILEAALIETIDPQGALRPNSKNESYIANMVHSLTGQSRIKDARLALQIRDAGNDAVHSPESFRQTWSFARIEENLLGTRLILEDLYA